MLGSFFCPLFLHPLSLYLCTDILSGTFHRQVFVWCVI